MNEAHALPAVPPAHVQQAKVMDQRSLDIVTAALVGEAGGEGLKGLQAVMNVIANRAGGDYRKFATEVLKPKQFSMFNRATGRRPSKTVTQVVNSYRGHPLWAQAQYFVRHAAAGTLPDLTGKASHYHARSVNPAWAKTQKRTTQVGKHLFYRESVADQLLRQLL